MALRGLRRLLGNIAAILTSDVVNRATTFVLYALAARELGAHAFGQLSLALALFYTFQIFAIGGLRTLVTREVARDPASAGRYLVNGSIGVSLFSLASLLALLGLVSVLGYAADTTVIILLLGLGLLPFALTQICEALFQAWERLHLIAYANVPVNIVKVGLIFALLQGGAGLLTLTLVLVGAHLAILLVEWPLVLRHMGRPRASFDPPFLAGMVRAGGTFFGIDGIIAIWASVNTVLLARLAGETEVGLYSAVSQLMVPVLLIYQSIVRSLFPTLCRRFGQGVGALQAISDQLIELLLMVALPMAVGLYFLAGPALLLLYGDPQFLQAVAPLRVMVWALVALALTSALGQVLVAAMNERATLRIVIVNVLVGLALGAPLIWRFGLMGAAAATLLTRLIDLAQHYAQASRLLFRPALLRAAWRPLGASAALAACLALMDGQPLALTVAAGGLVYGAALAGLTIWLGGGLRQLRARYLYLWSD